MIINLNTDFVIKHPNDVLKFSASDRSRIKHLEVTQWYFYVPKSIKGDQQKLVYKLGFLIVTLKYLQPETSYTKLFDKVKNEWHIFRGNRQMQRLLSRYKKQYMKKEEI